MDWEDLVASSSAVMVWRSADPSGDILEHWGTLANTRPYSPDEWMSFSLSSKR
jgi:hypothetical protein